MISFKTKMAIAYIILVILSFFWMLPFYVALVTSLKTHEETYTTNVLQPPSSVNIIPWLVAWNRVKRAFINSIMVSIPSTILCVLIGTLAGYYLSRFVSRVNRLLFFLIAVATFIPYQILLIPMTMFLSTIGIMGTHLSFITAYTILLSPWATLISAAFFLAIPKELEEAAQIDGASLMQSFFRVVLPVALPGIISTTIIIFMSIWNEFLFAVTLSTSPIIRTIQPEVANLRGTTTVAWNTLMSGSLIAILPPLIITLALGKYFIRGLLAGALKGVR
ncbi:MAG: carbohydrate ABC transporter permease [Thermoprotei archaeon]|nr:MAG: carbohydrate ABC transporter permease [Thermoprotei archaeon]